MEIQIEPHTLQRAYERGASDNEISDTLHNGVGAAAKITGYRKKRFIILRIPEIVNFIKKNM